MVTGFTKSSICFDFDHWWNHVALVWDNSESNAEMRVFLNGTLVNSLTLLEPNHQLYGHVLLFNFGDKLSLVDDLKIYNRLLEDAEIAELGAGGGPLSVHEMDATNRRINVYPNPTSENVSLVVDDIEGVDHVDVLDHLGRVVVHSTSLSNISVSNLSAGVYRIVTYTADAPVGAGNIVIVR